MGIFESFESLNISEECHKELAILISEKLIDVVNRAMEKGALPPFKKGTKLTSYNVKNKKNDTIADGDKSAELFVKEVMSFVPSRPTDCKMISTLTLY